MKPSDIRINRNGCSKLKPFQKMSSTVKIKIVVGNAQNLQTDRKNYKSFVFRSE